MARQLETATLEQAARDYARFWMSPDRKSPSGKAFVDGPGRVLQDFRNFDFDDEFAFLFKSDAGIKAWLGGKALAEFEKASKDAALDKRDEARFVERLKTKLAIDPNGNHIRGCVGTTNIGSRIVGRKAKVLKTRKWGEILVPRNILQPVYAGEPEERAAGNPNLAALPEGAEPWPLHEMHATNPNISAEAAIAALDALLARLDEGSTAATIRGRTGSQPVDPDASETGTLLFTLTMSDPAFTAAGDDSPGALAAADTITDDSSADATNTLTYCRVGATGTGADDHIDGSAGTSDADFIFNTVSIVSGAVVSMSSFTVLLPQGATAT